MLIISPDQALTHVQSVKLCDLDGQPFVWRERGSGARALVEAVLELLSVEDVAQAIEHGIGV